MGLSDVFIAVQYLLFIVLGFVAPFVTCLGYIWVDTFYPQNMSSLLSSVPVALIMASATLFTYVFFDRRSPPRITVTTVLTLTMAVWATLTTTWAVAPAAAWVKWDWATKTIAFSAFIPLFIRSRVQIEAFIQVFLFSLALNIFPVGIKGLISGGGYQQRLSVLDMTSGLTEGSTLATIAIMFVPIILHLRRHSLIFSNRTYRSMIYGVSVVLCFAAPVATSARTGLVGIAVLGMFLWLQSRHKIIGAAVIAVAVFTLVVASPQAWKDRMSTIETHDQDSSAEGRLLVWQWTWNFVKANPAGGGFRVDTTNHIISGDFDFGSKAFHSIYFEILGEQGFVGLAIFLAIIINTVIGLRGVDRRTRHEPDLVWCNDLARAMLTAFVVLLACGAFIGIAYQCMLWYTFALTTCLSEYVRRVQLLPMPRLGTVTRIWGRTPTPGVCPVLGDALPFGCRHQPLGDVEHVAVRKLRHVVGDGYIPMRPLTPALKHCRVNRLPNETESRVGPACDRKAPRRCQEFGLPRARDQPEEGAAPWPGCCQATGTQAAAAPGAQ